METQNTFRFHGAEVNKPCDMPDKLLSDIITISKEASLKFDVDREGTQAAEHIKKSLDDKYHPHWHVVIGNAFGSHVIHEKHHFTYFRFNERSYLIYKAGTGPRARKL